MKKRNVSQADMFGALACFTTFVIGLFLNVKAISWGASLDNIPYSILLIIGAISGLIIGAAGMPKIWQAVLLGYAGLPIGIAISSIFFTITQGSSVNEIPGILMVIFGFYVMFPVANLLFTWSFILALLIARAARRFFIN